MRVACGRHACDAAEEFVRPAVARTPCTLCRACRIWTRCLRGSRGSRWALHLSRASWLLRARPFGRFGGCRDKFCNVASGRNAVNRFIAFRGLTTRVDIFRTAFLNLLLTHISFLASHIQSEAVHASHHPPHQKTAFMRALQCFVCFDGCGLTHRKMFLRQHLERQRAYRTPCIEERCARLELGTPRNAVHAL